MIPEDPLALKVDAKNGIHENLETPYENLCGTVMKRLWESMKRHETPWNLIDL